ncbi:MAG: hypothetical protein ACTSRW_00135 [Candidatus Helarchaeota archaeon]
MERKITILKDYLVAEVDRGVEYLSEDLRKTLVGSLIEPVFKLVIGPEQRQRTIKLLEKIVAVASKERISDIDAVVSEHLEELLATDPINQNLRKSLSLYPEARGYLRDSYKNRIKFYNKLLMDSSNVETWEDLYKTGFASGEECLQYIMPEIEANKKLIALVKKNRRIINVSGFIRADVIDAMVKLHEYAHGRLLAIPKELF